MDDDYTPGEEEKKKIKKKVPEKATPLVTNNDPIGDKENAKPSASSANAIGTNATKTTTSARKPKTGPSRGISLKELVKAKFLEPGEGVFEILYRDNTYLANLTPEGLIEHEGDLYESPSSFSISMKRKVNPEKKADDGWKSVNYRGKRLEYYKHEMLKTTYGMASGGALLNKAKAAKQKLASKSGPKSEAPALKKQRVQSLISEANGIPTEPTDYVKNRPKREYVAKSWKRVEFDAGEDEHRMVPLESFLGDVASGEDGSQPFHIHTNASVRVIMDMHAHMSEKHEIIGLLAGSWDRKKRILRVEEAFPVRELKTEDNTINVEMDPESEVQVRDKIKEYGMVCVGWYHSHPCFPPVPSIIDLKNQLNYQRLVRDELSDLEPFVAAIVSPYDLNVKSDNSTFSWFYVSHNYGNGLQNGQNPGAAILDNECYSMALEVEHKEECQLIAFILDRLKTLVHWYAPHLSRTDLDSFWSFDGGESKITKLEKMMRSVASRLPQSWDREMRTTFLNAVKNYTKASWDKVVVQAQLQQIAGME